MKKSNIFKSLMVGTALVAAAESASAADWGSIDGVTIEAKLIGG